MGRARAMMLTEDFSQQDKRKFWCEVISTATKLDSIIVQIFRNVTATSSVPVGLRNHYFLHTFNHE